MAPRILVIRGGAIGDFVLTLPAIRLLRENFPAARIEVLGYKHIVTLAQRTGFADAVRSIEYARLAGFFAPGSELDSELVEYFAGFQQIISYLYDPDRFFEGNLRRCGVKNLLVGPGKLDDSEHAAWQLARPLQELALYAEKRGAQLEINAEDREIARQLLAETARPIVAIHPGSGSERKNWPVQNWIAIAMRIVERSEFGSILLIGGEADHANLRSLREALPPERLVMADSLPLWELAAVLAECEAFLGHDSGVSHIAGAAGARALLLFGPTDPAVWAPVNPGVEVITAPGGEMTALPVGVVWEKFAGHWP